MNPLARALTDRSVQTVSEVTEAPDVSARFRNVAEATGARSCLVIPLTYADTVFGALVVCAPETDPFSVRETTAFETLGRVVGFAINATNNRRLLLGNTAVELEVGLRGTDAWFLSAANRLDGVVTVEGLVPTGDGSVIEYATVESGDGEAVRAVLDDLPAVEETRPIA
ncbi:bacterio-opsin activator domain-containing protein, partial [Halobium palmae]